MRDQGGGVHDSAEEKDGDGGAEKVGLGSHGFHLALAHCVKVIHGLGGPLIFVSRLASKCSVVIDADLPG